MSFTKRCLNRVEYGNNGKDMNIPNAIAKGLNYAQKGLKYAYNIGIHLRLFQPSYPNKPPDTSNKQNIDELFNKKVTDKVIDVILKKNHKYRSDISELINNKINQMIPEDSQANDEIKAQLTVKFWEKITKRKKILDNQLANQLKALKEKLTDLQNLISRRFWGRDEQEQKNILKEELTQIKIEIHNYLIKGADTTLTKEEASELKTLLNSTRYFCGRDSKLDEFLKNKGGTVTLKKIIGKPPIPSTPSVTDAQLKLITEALTCPISCDTLDDPVTLITGQTYTKESIAVWFDKNSTCPNTRISVDKNFL